MLNPIDYVWLIPLLPLAAAAIVGLFGAKVLKGQSHWPVWLGVGGSAVISTWLLVKMLSLGTVMPGSYLPTLTFRPSYFTWIQAGSFKANAGFFIDPLTAVMLTVVTGVGFLIMVFSAGYMKGEKGYWRFFASLGLFLFAMTILVMSDNLVLMFLGWEGVGLASYLLIGFYSEQPPAREAAKKAFIMNRIGDLGFAIAIMLIFVLFGTVSFFGSGTDNGFLNVIHAMTLPVGKGGVAAFTGWQATAFHAIPYLLLLGCFGKSAQWPLFTWLPDAMAGPTPVSALIHAATMVTAGIYLTVRCSPLFVWFPDVLTTLAVIACFTSILTATIAMRQYDLKKVFAYSTVSQLGFMFVGVAALAPVAGIFHLVTHAFFKALLFLGAGVVMHATGGELDMRKLSGLKKILPVTNWLVLIGCAALAGFPLITSGFYSKDEILSAAFGKSALLGTLMLLCAGLTAYYTFRLYFRVFQGELMLPGHDGVVRVSEGMALDTPVAGDDAEGKHDDAPDHAHSAADHGHGHDDAHGHGAAAAHGGGHHSHEPLLLVGPLVVLAVGALLAGFLNFPERTNHSLSAFLGYSPSLASGYMVAAERSVAASAEMMPEAHRSTEAAATVTAEHQTLAYPGLAGKSFGMDIPEEERHHGLSHTAMMVMSGVVSLGGIALAYLVHLKNRRLVAGTNRTAIARLLEKKYWLDEIYDAAVVGPLWMLSKTLDIFDMVINALVWCIGVLVPNTTALGVSAASGRGRLQGYAVAMVVGLVVILVVVFRNE